MLESSLKTHFLSPQWNYLFQVLGVNQLVKPLSDASSSNSLAIITCGPWNKDSEQLMNKILLSVRITEFQHFQSFNDFQEKQKSFHQVIVFGNLKKENQQKLFVQKSLSLLELSSMLEGNHQQILRNKRQVWEELKNFLL